MTARVELPAEVEDALARASRIDIAVIRAYVERVAGERDRLRGLLAACCEQLERSAVSAYEADAGSLDVVRPKCLIDARAALHTEKGS